MAGEGELDTFLVKFAQKLAGNEKKWRDYALKKLRKWLESRATSIKGGMTRDQMLKVWKGLHYCMWMSDKPLIQEELADSLSKLLHCFKKPQQSVLFLDVFMQTEAREWFGIDRLRLDKFMMLVRRCVNEGFVVSKNAGWSKKSIHRLTDMYRKGLMCGTDTNIPDGLRYHLADIYLTELEKVGLNELSSNQVLLLLDPYCAMLGEAKNKNLFRYIVKNVFGTLHEWGVEAHQEEEEEESDSEEDGEEKEEVKRLPVDFNSLADRLFAIASDDSCLGRNRKPIYDLVTRLRDIAKGIVPVEDDLSPGTDDMDHEIEKAARDLLKFETKLSKKEAKKKGKKRKQDEASIEEPKMKKTSKESDSKKIKAKDKAKKKVKRADTGTPTADTSGSPKTVNSKENTNSKENKSPKRNAEAECLTPVASPASDSLFEVSAWDDEGGESTVTKKKKRKSMSALDSVEDTLKSDIGNIKSKKLSKVRRKSLPAVLPSSPSDESTASTKKTKRGKGKAEIHIIEDTSEVIMNGNNADKKGKSNNSLIVDVAPVNASPSPAVGESVKSKKKQKRKSLDALLTGRVADDTVAQEDVTEKKKKLKKRHSICTSEPLEEGEVELWIPSKKYSGPLKEKFEAKAKTPSPGSAFASFEKSNTPSAFVRKSANKTSPKTSTGKISDKLPSTPMTDSKRRVSFALNKNMAQDFEDSLTMSPVVPFDPKYRPDNSILKASPMNSPALKAKLKAKKVKRRSQASDFF